MALSNEPSGSAFLHHTTSLCGQCKQSIEAGLWQLADRIVMRKRCPQHGETEVLVSSSAAWYHEVMTHPPELQRPAPRTQVSQGCPFDCGPCPSHEQGLQLPIVPITSACNLDCPICYTHNKNTGAWHMSEDNLRAILGHLRGVAPERRIINLTGGEPTQHPLFLRLVELCAEEGIHRITISTHGLRFLKEEALLERLARLDARIILSFDSFRPEVNRAMLGGDFLALKLRVLELLEKYQVSTTLLPVLARGQNDEEVGEFIALALRKDFIRSVELHTMTFTGQSGADFDRQGRYTQYDVLCDIERLTGGALRVDDFVPSPAAHSLCYQVCYLLGLGGTSADAPAWLPYRRFMSAADLRGLLGGSLYLEPGPQLEDRLTDVMNRLWSGDIECAHSEAVLGVLKTLVHDVCRPDGEFRDRLRRAERHSKAVYLHAHMDEESFDSDRIRMCPVGIREPDGRNIPSCAYNVLYRERDPRFMQEPRPQLVTLGRGRL